MTAQRIATNKVVSITYKVRDTSGGVVEVNDLPVSYVHGAGSEMFPKIEAALTGHVQGDLIEVSLSPEEGFGPRNPGLIFTDDLQNVPPELQRIGTELEAQNAKGETLTFVVTRIENGKLTVDANHPFAGKTVNFEITVHGVRDASLEEIRRGQPMDPLMATPTTTS